MKTRHVALFSPAVLILACSTLAFPQHSSGKPDAASAERTGTISEPGNADQPVAIVAGEKIFQRDLAAATASQMLQIREQEYKVKSQALDELIRKKLVEDEARRRGVSVEKLYQMEVDSKLGDPSDDEVEGYYLAVKSQINQPLKDVKAQLKMGVKMLKAQQARLEYADSLRAKAQVIVLLQPPKVEVGYDSARVQGNPDAPVTIVEFSDFQCPYCKKAAGTLNDLLAKYDGKIKLAYRDFPMRQLHPQAQLAAEASRCAGEQGKYWEYHDALYADQSKLDAPGLTAAALKLGLDEKVFQACLASGKFKAQVEQDLQDGTRAGVTGTPAFFINGIFVNGAQPQAEFEKIIDRELAAAGSKESAKVSR